MKRKLVVLLLVSILISVTLPWVSAAPPGDRPPRPPPEPDPPPPPPPPPVYDAPVIHGPSYSCDYSAYPSTITVECNVTWDPSTIQRYVWLYDGSTRYTIPYVYEDSQWKFKKTIEVNPFSNHYLYVKAREIINYEYISLETTSATYTQSRITTSTYSPSGTKYAIILDMTPLSDKTDSDPLVRKGYWAHFNSWNEVKSKVANSKFTSTNIWDYNIAEVDSATEAGTELVNHLTHYNSIADDDDFIFIYIVSHGSTVGLEWGPYTAATWSNIDAALDTYDCERMVVVIESCFSGNAACFSTLGDTNRLLITSCSGDSGAYHIEGSQESLTKSLFTHHFIAQVTISFSKAFYVGSIECEDGSSASLNTQKPKMNVSMTHLLARIDLDC